MSTIVLATQNPGKVNELRSLLDGSGIEIIGLGDLDASFPEPVEDGTTFIENATIKAKQYAKLTGKHCLADDSGLEVDALDGKPGVISSHYAFDGNADGDAADLTRQQRDEMNIDRVLKELELVDLKDRTARFKCVMVLASPEGEVLATSEGRFEGLIGLPLDHPRCTPADSVPRGGNGFGYDPIFLVADDYIQTSAELEPDAKNAVSHRGHAVRAMIDQIKKLQID